MNKKQIKQLVESSFEGNYFNEKTVNKIVAKLDKADLRKYINGLKLAEKEKTVIIASPMINNDLKEIEKIFPNKKFIIKKDSTLLLGVKIVNNDMVYEFTLKNSFDKIVKYIGQNYA
jgi:hypothetical protein